MYIKTLDARYAHPYYGHDFSNTCRIRIYETPLYEDPLPTVYVATQLPDNDGTSITNAAEELAIEVTRFHRARRNLSIEDPRYQAVWVHQYPAGSLEPLDPQERLSVVSFETLPDGRLYDPIWEDVTRSFVESSLIHAALDD